MLWLRQHPEVLDLMLSLSREARGAEAKDFGNALIAFRNHSNYSSASPDIQKLLELIEFLRPLFQAGNLEQLLVASLLCIKRIFAKQLLDANTSVVALTDNWNTARDYKNSRLGLFSVDDVKALKRAREANASSSSAKSDNGRRSKPKSVCPTCRKDYHWARDCPLNNKPPQSHGGLSA